MSKTAIEWTDESWNPVAGSLQHGQPCSARTATRCGRHTGFSGPGQPYEGLTLDRGDGPKWTGEVRTVPDKLTEPLTWDTASAGLRELDERPLPRGRAV